ncbi:MAG: TonB-dependent receptor [Rhodocyclaceae bacterium]|jgi:iron complex outermembrane receptor protein|nr:TonB-dependent receptor [Rhodocyclaceae bacterium]
MKKTSPLVPRPLAALLWALLAPPALAQGVATERELTPVEVTEGHAALDPTLPTTSYSTTRAELERQSYLNTEDALRYAPNTVVRKRFVGDRNANLGGRSFGTTQPARGLAYADGYLISNFLGRFDAPRWSIIAPEEVARVDVLYGPFSALYPGNSIGTTVAITTRNPTITEASATLQAHHQDYDDYGYRDSYDNNQASLYAGTRRGPLTLVVSGTRLAFESQPMGYAAATAASGSVTGLPVATGARIDADPAGAKRVLVGAINMQKGVQEQAKLKAAYDFSPGLQGDLLYARWLVDYQVYNHSFLTDATGNPLWRGLGTVANGANINGARYTLPLMAPQRGREEHEQMGGRLRTRQATGWNGSVQLSSYQVLSNTLRQASLSDPLARPGVAGSDSRGDGTGWRTFELQATYTPAPGENHALTLGYHQNDYTLENRVFSLGDWRDSGSAAGQSQNYLGKTQLQALYAQDAWRFAPDWTATLGLRLERFEAYDGSQYDASATTTPRLDYADRRARGVSPKLSLAHVLNDEWVLRASLGRGVRFPTVSELFQGARSGTTLISNDPHLKAEKSDAKEFSALRETASTSLRLSLFEDDIRDAIFQQSQIVGATTVTTVQNVDWVRTRGVEAAFAGRDLWLPGLDLQASLALARSRTLEDEGYPAAEGKNWPRVPRVRATLLGSYRAGPWTSSLGLRHEGRQYGTLVNSDRNAGSVGAISSYTVADARLAYHYNAHASLALGVDNLGDRNYYVGPHPYPGRTGYLELKLSY